MPRRLFTGVLGLEHVDEEAGSGKRCNGCRRGCRNSFGQGKAGREGDDCRLEWGLSVEGGDITRGIGWFSLFPLGVDQIGGRCRIDGAIRCSVRNYTIT